MNNCERLPRLRLAMTEKEARNDTPFRHCEALRGEAASTAKQSTKQTAEAISKGLPRWLLARLGVSAHRNEKEGSDVSLR